MQVAADARRSLRAHSRPIFEAAYPESERRSHYSRAEPARQFDAIIHIDETRAVGERDFQPDGQRRSEDSCQTSK
jgi:erythromycin esterase-like protein